MNKSLIALFVFFAGALAGCVSAPKSATPVTVYDFGLPAARILEQGYGMRLGLEVRAPGWFDSQHVDYRLAYEDPLKLRSYAGSRWAANPGLLLGQSLRQQLGVVNAGVTECLLRIELQEFSQVFDSSQTSHGILQANISLMNDKRLVLAERSVAIRRLAPSPDASGGVKALVTASGEFGQLLSEWLISLKSGNRLAACNPLP